jgi:hypothetical protein
MAFGRSVTVKVDPSTMVKARRALTSRHGIHRAIVGMLEDDADLVASIAKEIAEGELHRREGRRRTPESAAFGTHYHDAFEVEVVDNPRIEAVQVRVSNEHPFAWAIEHGMRGHNIIPKAGGRMVFPYIPGAARGGVGKLGAWALTNSDADFLAGAWTIPHHPGMNEHRVMRRAAERYRDRTARQRKLRRS